MQQKNIQISILILGILGLGIFAFYALTEQGNTEIQTQNTNISFEQKEIDLGAIAQSVPKEITIQFTNSGEAPLIIYQVETSCGCTEAQWPKKPIKPGKMDEIRVTYDAQTPGVFIKTLTVFGNISNGSVRLQIMGEVRQKEITF